MNFLGSLLYSCLICLFFLIPGKAGWCFADQELSPFRLGTSQSIFANLSPNDAKAAIKSLSRILTASNLPISDNVAILNNIDELSAAVHTPTVDAVALTVYEYRQIKADGLLHPLYLPQYAENLAEQYMVLTHRKGSITKLADLRGKTLAIYDSPTMCLAQPWLDTLLIKAGLPESDRMVRETIHTSMLPQVVLPVFFRKVDACLVSRSGLHTMGELNPQVQEQLLVLDASPEVHPIVLGLRAAYHPPFRERILHGFGALQQTPGGQQVLTTFRLWNLRMRPRSDLDAALNLLEEYERLRRP